MHGKRIAVYGLGRSGLAIARAALRIGAVPTVYDQARPERMVKQDVLQQAVALGIELRLGWDGRFDPAEVDLLVTNPSVDMRSPVLRGAVEDRLELLSEIEFAYRISAAPIVAITGTNGKSTTTVMTYLALRACGIDAVLCGNIFGSGYPEVPLTQAGLNSTKDQVLVAEVSSFQLEWVSQFRPAVAGITNIVPDHLDRYDSFEQYAATKMRIFDSQTEEDFAVVRAHDPVVALSREPRTSLPPRRRGLGAGPQMKRYPGTVLQFGAHGEDAEVGEDQIRILDQTIRTEAMKVVGSHNFANAAMAGLLAFATLKWLAASAPERVGKNKDHAWELIDSARSSATAKASSNVRGRMLPGEYLPPAIANTLREFPGIQHRMEFLGSKNGVRVFNNSMCTNPDAVVKSAQALKGPNHLIMGGKDKELPFGPVRNYLASGMHTAYLFGEAKDRLNEQLGGGFPTYNTLLEAFLAATEKARPGEVIMLAPGCASTDQFQDFRDRGNVFKSIAKEWLES